VIIYLHRGDKGTRGDGGKGDWIVAWQSFLAGEGHYEGDYSPNYGPRTEAATMSWQKAVGLGGDGVVGNNTATAAALRGFESPWGAAVPASNAAAELVPTDMDHAEGWGDPNYPQPTDLDGDGRADLAYLNEKERQKIWGQIEYKVVNGKPVLTNDWYERNIRKVLVPQIKGLDVYGSPSSGNILFHKLAIPQLLGAMQEIEEKGLLGDLLTYGGSYNMRFIRGSTTTLSNHAFGVALDFNMAQNGLGKQAALVGEKGTLRRVAPIFERYGAFWGGWYRGRKDGMHFEFVKLIDTATLTTMVTNLKSHDHILPWLKEVA
jgi:hypothetical protein